MKKTLLLFLCVMAYSFANAQCANGCGNDTYDTHSTTIRTTPVKPVVNFVIFPNPTTDYIQVDKTTNLKEIRIYDMAGKLRKEFNVVKGREYSIADLNHGVYIVRFINFKNKVLQTKQIQILDGDARQ